MFLYIWDIIIIMSVDSMFLYCILSVLSELSCEFLFYSLTLS